MTKALAVGRKEFRQIRRDSRTLMILLFVPAFFLLLYGYALNFDIRHVALAVEDRDSTSQSRSVVSAFVNSSYFDLVASVYSPREAEQLLDRNTVRAVLVIPEGFGAKYRELLHRAGLTVQRFAEVYSQPIVLRPTRFLGYGGNGWDRGGALAT